MEINVVEKKVLSSDGIHKLAGKVFIPQGEIKGLFHIVHGMQEHMGYYEHALREIASRGYVAFGYDHLGHGHTVKDESELGFIAKKDGWKYLVNDVAVFGREMKREYGEDLPYILLGFSMGSFIVRLSAEKDGIQDKLIIGGTGGPNPAAVSGIGLCRLSALMKGPRHRSKFIDSLIFGNYNKKFKENDHFSWLSNDKEYRQRCAEDKLSGFPFTVSATEDLLHLFCNSNRSGWFSSAVTKKPILLISGVDDPVGNYGLGVQKVYKELKKYTDNVELVLYKGCRHHIFNDLCTEKAIEKILDFAGN